MGRLFEPNEREGTLAVFYGLPRSGKSYNAVREIWYWLRAGNPVVTNIELREFPPAAAFQTVGLYQLLADPDDIVMKAVEIKKVDSRGRQITVKEMPTEWPLLVKLRRAQATGKHTLLVLDESNRLFDRLAFKEFPEQLRILLQQYGKVRTSVIFITHQIESLSVDIRRQCGYFRGHTNLSRLPGLFGLVVKVLVGTLCFSSTRINAGGRPAKEIYDREVFWIRKKFSRIYDTYQLFNFDAVKREMQPRRLVFRLVIWSVFFLMAKGVLSLIWAFFGFSLGFGAAGLEKTRKGMGGPALVMGKGRVFDKVEGFVESEDWENSVRVVGLSLPSGVFCRARVPAGVPGMKLGTTSTIERKYIIGDSNAE